ncbi:MAG: Glycosyltransferases involved in cell wall bioproteini [Parcubacteria group bacterium Gr01-1014_106]|nr:MAG: Glycosyltransferases involved in cell wall bioproteini [Parcubacteria group bacterium Gr01-1014_106]
MAQLPSSASSDIRLSVVIPAYDEEQRLPRTLDDVLHYLERQTYTSEVLVVDDGSTDRTQDVARAQRGERVSVRVLTHPDRRNHGKGAAVRRGMLAARGRFRLFMDADNSTTVDHVERFWAFFDEGYDVVIGSRDVEGAVVTVHQPWYKECAGDVGNMLVRTLAVPGIYDTQAGFKMFKEKVVETVFPRLTIDRWGFDIEILAAARHRGYRIKEAPITWVNSPESKVTWTTYFEVLSEVWRVRRNLRTGLYG